MPVTTKNAEARYFIGMIPPEPIYGEAHRIKVYFKDRYNSRAALNSPPHITLHMPFLWKNDQEARLVEALTHFAAQQKPLVIRLNSFSAFEPRVIFINVEKSEELGLLQKQLKRFCRQALNLFNADYKEYAFHPHITLAFRDLKKEAFYDAQREFSSRKFEACFTAASLVLFKHDGNAWNVFKTLSFLAK